MGFPHSDIRGSTIARISPRLFAACHVLHRLLVPRHPPNALYCLILVFRHSHRLRDGRLFHMQRQTCSDQADVASTFEFSSRHDDQSAPRFPGSQTNRRTLFTMSHNGIRQDARDDGKTVTRNSTKRSKATKPSASSPGRAPWWRRTGLNRRPPACKAGALPLSYAPSPEGHSQQKSMVGPGRFELPTSRLSSARSNQLSYEPGLLSDHERDTTAAARFGKSKPFPRSTEAHRLQIRELHPDPRCFRRSDQDA